MRQSFRGAAICLILITTAAWTGQVRAEEECTILLPPGGIAANAVTDLWTDGIIPYYIDPTYPAEDIPVLLAGMAEWEARADVHFIERTNQVNWVHVRNDICPGYSGCANVGMIGGAQSLRPGAGAIGIVRHELGHTLGFLHEQQRSDRAPYISVNLGYIQDDMESNFAIVQGDLVTRYDFLSVMHYSQCAGAECPVGICPTDCAAMTLPYPYSEYVDYWGGPLPYLLGRHTISYLDTEAVRNLYGAVDCNNNGVTDDIEAFTDCNHNNLPDECDIALGTEPDCNANGIPDSCDTDCNLNLVPDDCDITSGSSSDCTGNGIPDECEPDCNGNGVADSCDIQSGTSSDCNANGIPDECTPQVETTYDLELTDLGGVLADCGGPHNAFRPWLPCDLEPGFRWWDTNSVGLFGPAQVEFSLGVDCHDVGTQHGVWINGENLYSWIATDPDCSCESTDTTIVQFDVPASLYRSDGRNVVKLTGIDNCIGFRAEPSWGAGIYGRVTTVTGEVDCNSSGWADCYDIVQGFSQDCNSNSVPDECDIASESSPDCNANGVPDECEGLVVSAPTTPSRRAGTSQWSLGTRGR